jgi:hypothetical protein
MVPHGDQAPEAAGQAERLLDEEVNSIVRNGAFLRQPRPDLASIGSADVDVVRAAALDQADVQRSAEFRRRAQGTFSVSRS